MSMTAARPIAPVSEVASARAQGIAPGTRYASLKAFGDRCIAVLLLAITGPVLLLAMALVKLTSAGPAIYSQTRVGRGHRLFTIYKLRTMMHQCESLTGACWSQPGDPRITPVGRFLRVTHLDELPQLWNVLRGEMSLVGPRPERPEFVSQLHKALPCYGDRLLVKPGVTGLAQVQLPADTDLASVRLKLAYDLYYVSFHGFWLDTRLVLATVLKMIGFRFGLLSAIFRLPIRAEIEADYHQRGGGKEHFPAA